MTMKDVASRIGRYHSYVKDYEDGQRRLDIVQLMEVAGALGSSLTAIAETVTGTSPHGEVGFADDPPEFAAVTEPGARPSADRAKRDAWYRGEWSRLCALLRSTRVSIGKSDGRTLTEQDVANRLREPQSFVSKYETMNRRLDLIEFEQVAAALDTTAVDLARTFERDARPYGAVGD